MFSLRMLETFYKGVSEEVRTKSVPNGRCRKMTRSFFIFDLIHIDISKVSGKVIVVQICMISGKMCV